jgi:hypothetical protein
MLAGPNTSFRSCLVSQPELMVEVAQNGSASPPRQSVAK